MTRYEDARAKILALLYASPHYSVENERGRVAGDIAKALELNAAYVSIVLGRIDVEDKLIFRDVRGKRTRVIRLRAAGERMAQELSQEPLTAVASTLDLDMQLSDEVDTEVLAVRDRTIATLHRQLSELEDDHRKGVKMLKAELSVYQKDVGASAAERISQLVKQLGRERRETQDLMQELKKAREQPAGKAQQRIEQLEAELAESQRRFAELDEKYMEARADVATEQQRMQALWKLVGKLRKQNPVPVAT